jgi:hypothetical protein
MWIEGRTIPHASHRYPTVGDWKFQDDGIFVVVSEMENSDYEFLVMLHELVEAYSCIKYGVPEEKVTEFDVAYEEARKEGDVSEPGDSPLAPYHRYHQFACMIEQLVASHLGINWKEYEDRVNALGEKDAENPA